MAKKKIQKIRRRKTKKRPTRTKRKKRKRRRRSPSNLAQDHYINKKNLLDPIPLEPLPHFPLSPGPTIKEKKKICTNSKALALYIFPNDIVPPRSRSVIRTERRMNATHYQCHRPAPPASPPLYLPL